VFLNNENYGFPAILIGNNQLSSIDYNFWGTNYNFDDVRKVVNNTRFKNFYYYEFYTNSEADELSVGDSLWYNFGIYLSSTGQRTNVAKLPSWFYI